MIIIMQAIKQAGVTFVVIASVLSLGRGSDGTYRVFIIAHPIGNGNSTSLHTTYPCDKFLCNGPTTRWQHRRA